MNRFNKNHGAKMGVESGEVKSYSTLFFMVKKQNMRNNDN